MSDAALQMTIIGICAGAFAIAAIIGWDVAGRGAWRAMLAVCAALIAALVALVLWFLRAEGYGGYYVPLMLGAFVWAPVAAGWLSAWVVQALRHRVGR